MQDKVKMSRLIEKMRRIVERLMCMLCFKTSSFSTTVALEEIEDPVIKYALKKMGLTIVRVQGPLFKYDNYDEAWLYLIASRTEDLPLGALEDDNARWQFRNSFVWDAMGSRQCIRVKDKEELLSELQRIDKMFYFSMYGKVLEVDSWPFGKTVEEMMVEIDLMEENDEC